METILFIIFVCIVNIVLWAIFLKKFGKLFSTDDIVSSTKKEIASLTDAMNRETARDLRLADGKLKELEQSILDVEKKFSELNNEMLQRLEEYRISLNSTPNQKSARYFSHVSTPAFQYEKNQNIENASETPDEPLESKLEVKNEPKTEEKTIAKDGEQNSKAEENLPNVSYSKEPIVVQKSFSERVRELYDKGMDVDMISHELSATTTEIQLIIDMYF